MPYNAMQSQCKCKCNSRDEKKKGKPDEKSGQETKQDPLDPSNAPRMQSTDINPQPIHHAMPIQV
jgi:hypothetical protein